MLTENREAAAAVARGPGRAELRRDAVERVRGQVLSIIDGDARDPDEIAGQTFNAMAWGDHPYGSALEGTRRASAR
jgi:zinc protease